MSSPGPDPVGSNQSEVLGFLAEPASHGLPPDSPVVRLDTHASTVFLAGPVAVKLKRAVRHRFLDFTTRDRRIAACRAELAVNRRFTQGLYCGLGAVRRLNGRLALVLPGAAGDVDLDAPTVLEPVVVMDRFPADCQLDRMAAEGRLDAHLADRLGVMAGAAMAAAEPRRIDWPEAFGHVVADSLTELTDRPDVFEGVRVAALRRTLEARLRTLEALMAARATAGRVRRCHGDLHLRNIVVLDGMPVPFDALEFDEALATTDTLYDLAFLVMDLLHRGLDDAAARVVSITLALEDDYGGLRLMAPYLAARALIRAKVTASRFDPAALDGTGAEAWRAEAQAYFTLAERVLAPTAARLVALGGHSGSGKTTLACRIAPKLAPGAGAIVLRSDVIRKQDAGVDLFAPMPPGSYTPAARRLVYERLRAHAAAVLLSGQPAILDATHDDADNRTATEAIAAHAGCRFDGLWLEAPTDALLARVTERQAVRADPSDAGPAVVTRQLAGDPGAIAWPKIDTSQDPAAAEAAILARLDITQG